MDPHSTTLKSRTCVDCHTNPKALGLGYGNLKKVNNKWSFWPTTSINKRYKGDSYRLDAFVDMDGHALVHTSRPYLRPFNKGELKRILDVGECLPCHRDFKDPVMKNWQPENPPKPCSRYLEIKNDKGK